VITELKKIKQSKDDNYTELYKLFNRAVSQGYTRDNRGALSIEYLAMEPRDGAKSNL